MQKRNFDKIWEARKQGFSSEEIERGFFISTAGAIARIEILGIYENDLHAAFAAKNTYGIKLIENVPELYPFTTLDYELSAHAYKDTKRSHNFLKRQNDLIENNFDAFVDML